MKKRRLRTHLRTRVRVHKEGYAILFSLLTLLIALNLLFYMLWHMHVTVIINLVISLVAFSFFLYFFRNPRRNVCIEDDNLVVAPADGRVVVIEPTEEFECFGGEKRIQVSIFMSVFSVHANWYPICGTVKYAKHHSGRHMAAYLPKSSSDNERSTILIETKSKKHTILVRQIAGALARRIVTYAAPNCETHLNDHLGFIKFGSRVDLFLPMDTEIFVNVGEKTRGNETIIARLKD